MGRHHQRNQGFVLDACTIINIIKNRATADLLKCHLEMNNCPVYINSVALEEAARQGYSKKEIVKTIQNYLDTFVTVKEVTSEVHEKAAKLENVCALLHHGDSAIAAFSHENHSTLITFDKGLLKGCEITGIPAFSPNMLAMGVVAA